MFRVQWGSDSLRATVVDGGEGFDWAWFGMAEHNASCSSPDSEYGCYTAEDCAYGYDNPVTGSTFGPFCHRMVDESITLTYSDDCTVIEGYQTCFPSDDYAGLTAYYFEAWDGRCYTGGTYPAYWAGFGCTVATVID